MKVQIPLEVLFDIVAEDAKTSDEAIATALYLVRKGAVEITEGEPFDGGTTSTRLGLAA